MKPYLPLALAAALACPAFATDTVVTSAKHSDAMPMMGQEAKDSTQVMWIGKDHMRIEDGERVTLVRADQKKMYVLDTKSKTYNAIDLPVDMKKYIPAEMAPMMEQMMGQMSVTITPTTDTKKIGQWNATRYTMTMSMPGGGAMSSDMWATKDVALDASLADMRATAMSIVPMVGTSMAAEMKKVDGLVVLNERTMKMGGSDAKSTETVTAIEQKEPPAGIYDLPEGFTEKPFDPMSEMRMGGGRGRGPGSKPGGH